MKIENENLNELQKPQLNIGAVSGSFLSNLEHRMNEILVLGLDITMLKFNQEDALKFKAELKEISGIDVSSVKMYKGISTRKSKEKSKIIAMDKFRNNYSRAFDMANGRELF
jgi:hypothetical protein